MKDAWLWHDLEALPPWRVIEPLRVKRGQHGSLFFMGSVEGGTHDDPVCQLPLSLRGDPRETVNWEVREAYQWAVVVAVDAEGFVYYKAPIRVSALV